MRLRALGAVAIALAGTRAMALSLVPTSVVDLLKESDAIVSGTVEKVSDGIDDRGFPYTEVTLEISESVRGDLAGTYTFRQFGLMKPRPTKDGKRMLMPAPEGFPRYAAGEQVVLFLYPAASVTGLRTTAGLTQGKFTVTPGRLENGVGNAGLFRGVRLSPGLAEAEDKAMLATVTGAVSPDAFLSFVRRAVKGRWVETGRLTEARSAR